MRSGGISNRPSTIINAFTLVELLVVVAILLLLAGLVFPSVLSAVSDSQMAQSMNNLRQLVIANQSYAADNGYYCPADDRWNNRRWHGARSSAGQPFDPTKGFLADYLGKSRRVGICPLFSNMIKDATSFELGTGGYGYNSSYIGGQPGKGWDRKGFRISAMPSQIQQMRTVMFTTSGYANGPKIQEYPFAEPPFWDYGSGPSGQRPSPTVHFRFRGKALVGWCDGRVTAEECDPREVGYNPHGGDANQHQLGWFGPDEENGFWNPNRQFSSSP